MAMLRVADDVHLRFKKYVASLLIDLDEVCTVNEALGKLLTLGERDMQIQKTARASFVFAPQDGDRMAAAKQAKAVEHLKNIGV